MVSTSENYKDFIVHNRERVNRYLNKVLWLFLITGPAIALGLSAGIFTDVGYGTCVAITVMVVAMAGIHLALIKTLPNSVLTGIFALTALDILIVYMNCSHVNIHLAWFLVPLLSVLFCEKPLYFFALAMNYVLMFATTWITAPYNAGSSGASDGGQAYFVDLIGSFTIETVVMAISGFLIVKLTSDYFMELIQQREVIEGQEKDVQEKMDVLDSMAEIYDNVNLISFIENTEMSLRDAEQKKHFIDMENQTHTLMNQRLKKQILPDQLESFLTFTNITTVRERLKNKKIISADFIDIESGWFRAQYITVEPGADGMPDVVIYTTRNVDEERKREEHLIKLSLTDELTRLYNRRCYEDDLDKLRKNPLDGDFVLFSVDVNGLKIANDTKGHAAGDELIEGAASCLMSAVGESGKTYRTGGDEFAALVHEKSPERMREEIHKKASEWHGEYTDKMTVSVGYAAYANHPDATVDDLEHIADADMYAAKDRYYRETGIDRRRFSQTPR